MKTEAYEISDPSKLVKKPLVSVLMLAYNHENYLAEAILGVISQKCDFEFELIIGEDASNDGTRKVAIEFQKQYPEIIRIIYSDHNIGMNANSFRIFCQARGEYVAYCEGDDFWCASDKLARQIEIIRDNPEIGIVHTDWTRAQFLNGKWIFDLKKSVHRRVSDKYLYGDLHATWYFPKILRTCTILLRKGTMEEWYSSGIMDEKYHFGDSVLAAYITSRWKVGYVPSVMAVYRVSPNSALRSGAKARVAFYKSALTFDTAARSFFADKDYRGGYRWDSAAGLLLWGFRARDFSAIKQAILDFQRHFNILSFIKTGLQNISMRCPTLRRQARKISKEED